MPVKVKIDPANAGRDRSNPERSETCSNGHKQDRYRNEPRVLGLGNSLKGIDGLDIFDFQTVLGN
jgi:hypothetical protein